MLNDCVERYILLITMYLKVIFVLFFQNWFKVKAKDKKPHDRYLFLFKARILVCKVRKVAENRYVFILKEIIRVSKHTYTFLFN